MGTGEGGPLGRVWISDEFYTKGSCSNALIIVIFFLYSRDITLCV